MKLPRVVVAGTRSGVGKTSVAVGLMAALAARGLRVSGHKVGPDFIDPSYHALATGRPPRNLDAFLSGADLIPRLLAHGAAGADLAVIEGVMGLFDGRGSGDEASTAHVARLTATPVVLVVDASAASRSVAAEVHGFATFDPEIDLAGVILNRVGSEGHAQVLREALEPLGVKVLGVLRRDDRLVTPARHLGLIPARERGQAATATVRALGAAVTEGVDLDAVVRTARTARALRKRAWSADAAVAGRTVPGRPVVAVADGPAFTFVYEEHRELLRAAGGDVATFDPTHDESLPDGTAALYLGGGFPEEHVEELAGNGRLRASVAGLAVSRRPIVAECGGLLYLCGRLEGRVMCGVVDADAAWGERLTLGYHEATTGSDSPLGPAGTPVRAHEFHRTVVTPRTGGSPAWRLGDGDSEGFAGPTLHASYLHPHWTATPKLPAALVAAAAAVSRRKVAT